jgi:hypothetical protein
MVVNNKVNDSSIGNNFLLNGFETKETFTFDLENNFLFIKKTSPSVTKYGNIIVTVQIKYLFYSLSNIVNI